MINYKITLAKELGRVPDEYEIGQKMREVVSTHPKLKRKEKENKILNSSLAVQRNKDEANKHRRQDSIQGTPRVRMINKMLKYNLTQYQIADVLELQLSTIQKYILKHRLPRKQVVPIPSKSDRRQI
tara:strand:- start:108 stop:488 length:381 start_codon:yes stop_codon:yes gene_type:complete